MSEIFNLHDQMDIRV